MPRGLIYTRVSTKEQTENLSLQTQREACADYCKREGIDVEIVFEEQGESAKTANRPELQKMLAYCSEHRDRVDFVIVYAVNRLAREAIDHLTIRALLKKFEIQLRSVTEAIDDSSSGRFMELICAGVAQYDNDLRSERTVAGMQAALALGRWTHQAPVGYRNSGSRRGPSLVHDEVQAPLISEAFHLVDSGEFTRAEALRELNSRGLRTAGGQPVTRQTFERLLRNPIYYGVVSVPSWGIEVRGDFEPIIDEELFQRVQVRIDGPRTSATVHVLDNPDFPLRRFMRCDHCGAPLTASWSTGRGGKRYAYYHCRNTKCKGVRSRRVDVETAFAHELQGLAVEGCVVDLLEEIVRDVAGRRQTSAESEQKELVTAVEQLGRKKDLLVEAYVYEKGIDIETYQRELDKLTRQLAEAQLRMDRSIPTGVHGDVASAIQRARTLLVDPAGAWRAFPQDPKIRFQWLVFPTGVTYDGKAIGTAATSPFYRVLQAAAAGNDDVAYLTGLEPEGESVDDVFDGLD